MSQQVNSGKNARKRFRFQFHLLFMLTFVTFAGLGLATLLKVGEGLYFHRMAIRDAQRLGAQMTFGHETFNLTGKANYPWHALVARYSGIRSISPVYFLDLQERECSENDLQLLLHMVDLRRVQLRGNSISDKALEPLFQCKNLNHVVLDTPLVSIDMIQRLCRMPSINRIAVSLDACSPKDIVELEQNFPDKYFVGIDSRNRPVGQG